MISMLWRHRTRSVARGAAGALMFVLALVHSSMRVDAQQPTLVRPPVRDATATEAKPGTAVIRGRVSRAADHQSLRGVRVRLNNGSVPDQLTDDEGRFAFTALTAGAYIIEAMKGGYITVSRGAVSGRPTVIGPSIQLADGQVEEIELALEKGGVISGQVIDPHGKDVSNAYVSLYRFTWTQGYRALSDVSITDESDDRGQFRLFGIAPGTYLLGAVIRRPTGDGTTAAYYPAAFSPADAVPITIRPGEEVSAIISLVPAQAASIRGTVRRSDGQSTLDSRLVYLERADRARTGLIASSTTVIRPDGTFTFSALPPGEYVVQSTSGTDRNQDRLFAMERVVINGSDMVVPLVLSPPGTVHGWYRFDTGDPPSDLRPPNRSANFVSLVTLPAIGQPLLTVAEDWSFVMTGLVGTYRLRVPAPAGWFVKRITLGGNDITYTPLAIHTGELDGLEVLLTRRATSLNVSLKGATDQIKAAQVVVFPEDESKLWPQTPFLRFMRFDRLPPGTPIIQQSGPQSITTTGLPPGKYLVAAVTNLLGDDWQNPDVLKRLRAIAVSVDLAEEEPRSVEVPVVSLP